MSHGQSTVNRGFSVNNKWKLRTRQKDPSVHRGLFMVTFNQFEALSIDKSESNFLYHRWSLTEVSFQSRSAEELSVPEKIAKTKGNNG